MIIDFDRFRFQSSVSIDFDRLYQVLRKSNFQSILTCDSERIVVAWPPSYFASGQSDQFAHGDFRRKTITQSLCEEY